jgi:hypothetical protein
MRNFTLTIATTLLAIVSAANAESSTTPTTEKQNAPSALGVATNAQAPAERLTYADFRRVHRLIESNYERLKSVRLASVRLAALQSHMSVDRVNHLFQRYAHENAEQYLANLKRSARGPSQNL